MWTSLYSTLCLASEHGSMGERWGGITGSDYGENMGSN